MKKTLLISILALLGMTQAVSQEYEYIPFVREGVKWVYFYDNPFEKEVLDMDKGRQYYSFELIGDVEINGNWYKPVVLTHHLNTGSTEIEDFTPAYLREEDQVVYAILPDGIMHPQCPIGFCGFVSASFSEWNKMVSKEEFVLYDFKNPESFYESFLDDDYEYLYSDMITVGNHQSKRHFNDYIYGDDNKIIEGVGYDGDCGTPLWYFELLITGMQVSYGFSHVIEDGQIIYKGKYYDPGNMTGIDEVVAEMSQARQLDDNYYNLMGQPMGKTLPTTPGIYIHHGNKICVSRMR